MMTTADKAAQQPGEAPIPTVVGLARLGTLIYVGLLLAVNRLPPTHSAIQTAGEIPSGDKLGHLLGYGLLAVLVFGPARLGRTVSTAMIWLLLLIALGIVDELTQPFWDRTADVWDALADTVAVLVGWLLIQCWAKQNSSAYTQGIT